MAFSNDTIIEITEVDGIAYELHFDGIKALFRIFDIDAGAPYECISGPLELIKTKYYDPTVAKVVAA